MDHRGPLQWQAWVDRPGNHRAALRRSECEARRVPVILVVAGNRVPAAVERLQCAGIVRVVVVLEQNFDARNRRTSGSSPWDRSSRRRGRDPRTSRCRNCCRASGPGGGGATPKPTYCSSHQRETEVAELVDRDVRVAAVDLAVLVLVVDAGVATPELDSGAPDQKLPRKPPDAVVCGHTQLSTWT